MNEDELVETGLADLLADEPVWAEPRADGADGLLSAIRAEARADPTGLRRSRRPRGAARSRPWRRPLGLVAAAAAVVLVVAVAVAALSQAGDDTAGREVAIAGTELAPDASAVATVEELGSGVAIQLDVTELPPAEAGTYYQAWVKGPDGLVTVGTFHMRDGDDTIELWAGVDLDRYPTLTVTLQQEGAGQESSGQVVLSGEIGS